MQTRASRLSIVTALAFCALWFTSPPGLAQGVLKPVEALIVNPPSRPVPVNVIAPPAAELAPLVTCNVTLARFTGGAPFAQGITSQRVLGDIACPAGVSHLDVQRVIYDPSPGSENVAHYHLLVGTVLPTLPPSDVAGDFQPLAMLTEGAPDVVLPRPRRIDLTDTQRRLRLRYGCGSGVAGIAPACSGVVYLIGTAVR